MKARFACNRAFLVTKKPYFCGGFFEVSFLIEVSFFILCFFDVSCFITGSTVAANAPSVNVESTRAANIFFKVVFLI